MKRGFFKKISTRKSVPISGLHDIFSECLMADTVETAAEIINEWISPDHDNHLDSFNFSSLFSAANHAEGLRFIQAVNDLHATMQYTVSVNPGSGKHIKALKLLQAATKHLQKEFFWILKAIGRSFDSGSVSSRPSRTRELSSERSFRPDSCSNDDSGGSSLGDYISPGVRQIEGDTLDPYILSDLKMIVDCLISTGHTKECLKLYKMVRKPVLHEELSCLGIEKLSFYQLQKMDQEHFDSKIKRWLPAVKVAVLKLFQRERVLCDHIFSEWSTMSEFCFAETARENALALFTLPESVAKFRKTPELLFCTLDLYGTISVLLPDIQSIFCYESTSVVRSHAVDAHSKLGKAISLMIEDFELAVQKDGSKMVVEDGSVHPLTNYVMDYISFFAEYSGAISDILRDWPLAGPPPFPDFYMGSNQGVNFPPITLRLAWQILILLCKIDSKTELYDDPAISYLFLANNLRYVTSRVSASQLKVLLGHDWLRRQEEKVKQYIIRYEKLAWGKVLASLPEDPTADIPLDQVENLFKKFNSTLEDAYKKQVSWNVPDRTLRDEIKEPLLKKLIPAYQAFFDKYNNGGGREASVKFTPDDVRSCISNLFLGKEASTDNSIPSTQVVSNNRLLSFYKTISLRLGKRLKG